MSMGGSGEVFTEINVTPFIDVMLVLLIIFMIVTRALTAGYQASIARAKNTDAREEGEGEIRLGIDKDGKFYLDITGASLTNGRYVQTRTGLKMREGQAPDGTSRLSQVGELGVAIQLKDGYAVLIYAPEINWFSQQL